MKKAFYIFGLCLGLTHCALYQKPNVPTIAAPPTFRNTIKQQTPSLNPKWWENFHDQTLSQLIEKATQNNYDYQMALKNILIAQTYVTENQSYLFPQMSLNYNSSRNAVSASASDIRSAKTLLQSVYNYHQLTGTVSYEVDIWHRIGNSISAAKALVDANAAASDIVKLTLLSDVSQTYWQIQTTRANIHNLQQQYKANQTIVALGQNQYQSGLVNIELINNTKTQMEQQKSELDILQKQEQILTNTLAYLVGEYPETFSLKANARWTHPPFTTLIPAGIPSQMIARRPDIQEAYYQMLSTGYIEKQKIANFLPTFSLTGGYGFASQSFRSFINDTNAVWNIGLNLLEPVINYQQNIAEYRRAKFLFEKAILNYKNTVISAYQEVDNALVSYEKDYIVLMNQGRIEQYARSNFTSAKAQYRAGLIDYSTYQFYYLKALQASVKTANQQMVVLTDIVQVYKTLGCGL